MANSIWPADEQTETLLAAVRDGDDDAVNRLLEKHRRRSGDWSSFVLIAKSSSVSMSATSFRM